MIFDFKEKLLDFLGDRLQLSEENSSVAYLALATVAILLVAWLSNFLVKRFVLKFIRTLTEKTKTKIGKYLIEEKFFHRVSHLAPAFVIGTLSSLAFAKSPTFSSLIETLVNLYLVFIGLWVIDAVINTGLKLYQHSELSSKLPLKGVCQAAKIIINSSGVIFILSILLDKSPLYFFSGLGALTAVLLLVFKDAILGLVAGIQLSVNNMVRHGDWIEMPKYGADGDVIEVSLTTVKVQNWDKTITSIPAHALVSDAFKNWRGMSESGGRRIKRSLFIDLSSIKFLGQSELSELKKISLLQDYLNAKLEEIGANDEENLPNLPGLLPRISAGKPVDTQGRHDFSRSPTCSDREGSPHRNLRFREGYPLGSLRGDTRGHIRPLARLPAYLWSAGLPTSERLEPVKAC